MGLIVQQYGESKHFFVGGTGRVTCAPYMEDLTTTFGSSLIQQGEHWDGDVATIKGCQR
jgi:hypothetical protein